MNRNGDAAAWEGWEFFIRSKEYAFACVIFRRLYIPPLCTTSQDLAVVMRCPASELDQDACEVLLDECRFVADSMSSTCMPKTLYPIMLQARLDALQFTENGYRHTEGQLSLAPQIKQRAAVKFVKSIVQLLDEAGALQDETLINAEVFAGIPIMNDPIMVAQELLSDAEARRILSWWFEVHRVVVSVFRGLLSVFFRHRFLRSDCIFVISRIFCFVTKDECALDGPHCLNISFTLRCAVVGVTPWPCRLVRLDCPC
jgi:hypothetical protein